MRMRDLGYSPGVLPTGPKNSILDVQGVSVGQTTIHEGDVHKGVTVIFPRPPDDIQTPCYAGIHTLNGNGEVTGAYQIKEWGITNTPLALTNSVSLGITHEAIWTWLLKHARSRGQDDFAISRNYGSPVVGETCDWWLNDIEGSLLEKKHVMDAFEAAKTQDSVLEGSYGGGTGMSCHQFKGGSGTSSRIVKGAAKDYTIGVMVQSNYGYMTDLQIGGVPIGMILAKEKKEEEQKKQDLPGPGRSADGSIVILIITDAPLLPHQLTRLAQRATIGLAQVGGHGTSRTHSGDIFVALSTANTPKEQLSSWGARGGPRPAVQTYSGIEVVKNESIDALFPAVAEATEEAILNSLVGAREGMSGHDGVHLPGFPVNRVKELLAKHLVKV